MREENKRKAQSAFEKKRCSMFVGLGFIVLHAYVVITCSSYWSLTTFHHSPFIISLPFNP